MPKNKKKHTVTGKIFSPLPIIDIVWVAARGRRMVVPQTMMYVDKRTYGPGGAPTVANRYFEASECVQNSSAPDDSRE